MYGHTFEGLPNFKALHEQIIDAIRSAPNLHPIMREWTERTGAGARARLKASVFRHPNDSTLKRHRDNAEGFPTQAILNLAGMATFNTYGSTEDEVPEKSTRLKVGDLLLLRGDEWPAGQKIHGVSDIEPGRVVMLLNPDPVYDQELRARLSQLGLRDLAARVTLVGLRHALRGTMPDQCGRTQKL